MEMGMGMGFNGDFSNVALGWAWSGRQGEIEGKRRGPSFRLAWKRRMYALVALNGVVRGWAQPGCYCRRCLYQSFACAVQGSIDIVGFQLFIIVLYLRFC